MKITVAGVQKEIADDLTVSGLIRQEKIETPEYVSVSVNEDFVTKEDFDTRTFSEGDEVEFLYFMGGGAR